MEASVTIPFPVDLFEALAQRVAAIPSEQPPAERYLDAEAAARYPGVPVTTLRTKEWRNREGIPYGQLDSSRLIFDRLALDERFASCSGLLGGGYTVARIASRLGMEARVSAKTDKKNPYARYRTPHTGSPTGLRASGNRTYYVTVGSRHQREREALLVQRLRGNQPRGLRVTPDAKTLRARRKLVRERHGPLASLNPERLPR